MHGKDKILGNHRFSSRGGVGRWGGGKGGVYSFNGPYGEALLEKSTFFRPEVYKRGGVSLAEVYGRVGKSVWSAKGSNRANRDIKKKRKTLV